MRGRGRDRSGRYLPPARPLQARTWTRANPPPRPATPAVGAPRSSWFYLAMTVTFLLGAAFIALEVREFEGLVARGAGPTRSAFLSAFFTVVGCHGLHLTGGCFGF